MDRIRADIDDGRVRLGDRLESVREMSARLGVGQSSVREAIRVLSYTGLLTVKHGGGIFVTGRAGWQDKAEAIDAIPEGERASLHQVIELRLVLEPAAARWAADRATGAERAEIQERCDQVQMVLRRADYDERPELQEQDLGFHMAIVHAAHNPLFVEILERVRVQLRLVRHITSGVPEMRDSALRFHPQIAQSIAAGNAIRAEHFSRAHVEDILWWLEAHDRQRRAADPEGRAGGLLSTEISADGTGR